MRLLEKRSTVSFRLFDHTIAMFPSMRSSSPLSSNYISAGYECADAGAGLLRATGPLPVRHRLNSPSHQSVADDRVIRDTAFCFTVDLQARKRPSSSTSPSHSAVSTRSVCLYRLKHKQSIS